MLKKCKSNLCFSIFTILILLFSTYVSALERNQYALDTIITSRHDGPGYYDNNVLRPFNENNFGIGISNGLDVDKDLMIGHFKNSYHRDTFYAGVFWHKEFKLGLSASLSSHLSCSLDKLN